MNYIQEINLFNEWLATNPAIKPDDIVLWYTLMSLNNACGWKAEFTVAVSTIKDRSRLSRSSIYRSRNKLVQFGRIHATSREGNESALYRMIPFASHGGTQPGTQSVIASHIGTQSGTQPGTQSGTQPGTITKLNQRKLNDDDAGRGGFAKKLGADQLFFEKIAMSWNIDGGTYRNMINGFEANLAAADREHADYSSYKRHFLNWGAARSSDYRTEKTDLGGGVVI